MPKMTLLTSQPFIKKFIISVSFGLIGLLFSGYAIRIPFGDFQLNFIWSIAFPLVITLAYGLRFGLLSITCGLTFLYPFILGYMNGYGSFVGMLVLYVWIVFHGLGKDWRDKRPTRWNHPMMIQLFYSVVRLLIYALLFQPLMTLNPPPWNLEAFPSIQSEIVWYFSVRGIFMEMMLLLIVDTVLLLPRIRQLFNLETDESMRYNGRVLTGFLGGGLLFISFILAVQYTLIDEVPLTDWLLPPNPKTSLTLFLSSFLFMIMAGVTMRYVEKTLTNERAFKTTYERYQAIFEQMQDIYLELMLDGTIVNASPSIYSTLDLTENQLIGTNFCQLFSEVKGKAWLQELEQQGGFIEKKMTVLAHSGKTLVWSIHLKKIQLKEGEPRLVAMIRDMTDIEEAMEEVTRLNSDLERRVNKRTKDLHASIETLERFNYVVSHDLKTPIRAIDAYTEMIEEDEHNLSGETKDALASIRHIVADMIRLIERLLHYSRVNQATIEKERVPLQPVITDVLDQLRLSHDFTVIFNKPLPTVLGEAVLIKQVFLNVLDNAVTYKRKDEPLLLMIDSVETEDTLSVLVTDNGCGIAPDDLPHVWDLFTTGHQTGTGIGLSTVKRIMEALGGSVQLESRLKKGTTVTLVFPKA
ncbi:ATP-binding protein [Halolactibacillus sp. JCM 19043]|uniref:sensor histidine kinase n=1 Tax=Halolactibacillus sp. JCM 19043 TaxID=1460638 RepID=UPI00078675E5|nr:PAS domain-containing sensor histidine kinase [Halolactibacillus sp. JCM 19043]